MNKFAFALASLLIAGTSAQAARVIVGGGYYHRGGGYYGGGYYGGGYYGGCRYHRCGGGTSVGVACAPEVVEGNVAATDRTLKAVAATPDFAQAADFKAEVARISALNSPSDKLGEYFGMIGVDANDKNAVAAFVGARDVNGAWLTELQHNTGLNANQAETVATQLQTALRGGLQ